MRESIKLLGKVDAFLDEASKGLNDVDCRKLKAICTIIDGPFYSPVIMPAKRSQQILDELPIKEPKEYTIDKHKAEVFFKEVLKRRAYHCLKQLVQNTDGDTFTNASKNIAYFSDGSHFSQPVYEDIIGSLLDYNSMDKWPRSIWLQIIRQMFIEHNLDEQMFNVATEYMLVCEK